MVWGIMIWELSVLTSASDKLSAYWQSTERRNVAESRNILDIKPNIAKIGFIKDK
jgi:hypothetical protein